MERRPLHIVILLFFGFSTFAQQFDIKNYRTYDGSNNNLAHPGWGMAKDNVLHNIPTAFSDSMSAPAGKDRPNPRVISNSLLAQNGSLLDTRMGLSDYTWAFGQLLDHDFGLTDDDLTQPLMIHVPSGDPWYDPQGLGTVVLPMARNKFDPASGTDPSNPRRFPNEITAYIDASNVYGSDEKRAHWLRSFSDGKLKVSKGNLLPFNTVTGEFDGAIDPDAPNMGQATGHTGPKFVAGDVRANENAVLTCMHTLFVREHNRQCDVLKKLHPDWTDEQLYQHARKMVSGITQAIVYEEWLPAIGVKLEPYQGYNDSIHAQVYNVFTAAAFRLGHTMLSSKLMRMDNDGKTTPEGDVLLRDIFFNPGLVYEMGTIDPFLKGLAAREQQSFDARVVDDVRNFLFGAPGSGGLDLVSININRGRERGLPDFNSIRKHFGLEPYLFFQQLNPNADVFIRLMSLYRNLDNIDPWVGFLSEKPMDGKLIGPTLHAIFTRQFSDLREGDRFYYENDPILADREKAEIKRTRLHDVIMRNTGIKLMQNSVLKAMPHEMICNTLTVDIQGKVITESRNPIPSVGIRLGLAANHMDLTTDPSGRFEFDTIYGCQVRQLVLEKFDDNAVNGVTTLDLILIQKHILGVQKLDSPYKMIAADVDESGEISVSDMIKIRKIILSVEENWAQTKTWRFLPASYQFKNPDHPMSEDMPEPMEFELLSVDMEEEFIGIKMGDVNSSVDLDVLAGEPVAEVRQQINWTVADQELKAGSQIAVPFIANAFPGIEGFQAALHFDNFSLKFNRIEPGYLPGLSTGNFAVLENKQLISISWNVQKEQVSFDPTQPIFTLVFDVQRNGRVSDYIKLDRQSLIAEVYGSAQELFGLNLQFEEPSIVPVALQQGFELFQNQPNPFNASTSIPFFLPADDEVRVRLIDASGKVLYQQSRQLSRGMHQWELNKQDIPATGILIYEVQTSITTATKKMIVQ